MKKPIYIIAGTETYKNLATFKTIDELNKTVRTYKEKFADQLNKNQLAVLVHLHNYSATFFGVSFRTKKHIAESLNISRRTVIRACQYLESLGIIKQLEMKRKSDMKQTSNIIVIQPIIVEECVVTQAPSKNEENCHTKKTSSISLKQNTLNKRNIGAKVDDSVDSFEQANFIAHWVPERFISLVRSFYSEAKTIQEFWKVVRQCNKVVDYSTGDKAFTPQQETEIGMKAIKEFVMKVKNGVNMKKGKFAYFNGVVNKLMDKLYFDNDFMLEN
jgi:DNA-binding Lrp family transcriptional regulator